MCLRVFGAVFVGRDLKVSQLRFLSYRLVFVTFLWCWWLWGCVSMVVGLVFGGNVYLCVVGFVVV